MSNQALTDNSLVLWILDGQFVTESGRPIEFTTHKWLIDYMHDDHPDKVVPKCAQVGLTVAETLDEIHKAGKKGINSIHTLQNSDVIRGFVQPKVNPIIYNNPGIKQMVKSDSENIKQFGNGFVFYRGAQAESQAINISADILKIDEMDRSNQRVVEMFQSRLEFSKYKWVRRFSNPSAIGYGVDTYWQTSNQFHWMIRCHHCNHTMYIDFEQSGDLNHFVDRERKIYACGKCLEEISDEDRIRGFWFAKYGSRTNRHGYWFSQMMASWISAAEIVKKFEENSIDYFYNFVLGKAYTPADLRIDRDTVLNNCKPVEPVLRNVAMGTDVGKPHWYWLATPQGYVKFGKTTDWDELEYIFNFYQCESWVIDAMPEFTKVQEMIRKYPGKVWGCYFARDTKNVGAVRWGEGDKKGIVNVDRTKALDRYVNEITSHAMPFYIKRTEMDEYIAHAGSMFRAVESDDKGTIRVDWKTQDGRPDHLVFAGLYARIALERVFSGGGQVVETEPPKTNTPVAPTVRNNSIEVSFDIDKSLELAQRRR